MVVDILKRKVSKLEGCISKQRPPAQQAKAGLEERIFDCADFDTIKEKLSQGIAKIFWCGNKECGLKIEDDIGAGILGIPTEQSEGCSGKCPACGSDATTQVYVARTY